MSLPNFTLPNQYFGAMYASEHVAGGEFVIGLAFAAWGVSLLEVVGGLLLGNLLATLSWALVCAPVAVRARLSFFEYLTPLMGNFAKLYHALSVVIFGVIAGGMMTISALAINAMLGGVAQLAWYPSDIRFVLSAVGIGALVVSISIKGLGDFSRIARLCAPWLFCIFFLAAALSAPHLIAHGHQMGLDAWQSVARAWSSGLRTELGFWHIAAFAWGLNLPLHLGMGDLSTLRFAQSARVGYYSSFAAFGGHFLAWIACGLLGAATAIILKTPISSLDVGQIALPILGMGGVFAVVIASVTTAIPSFYRAGLGLVALVGGDFRTRAWQLGAVVMLMACLPLIFLNWLDIMAYFNILTAPVGAMICAEHFILPRLGIAPFWRASSKTMNTRNLPMLVTLGIGLITALICLLFLHLFFIFIAVYLICLACYTFCAYLIAPRSSNDKETLYARVYGDATHHHPMHDNTLGKRHLIWLIPLIIAPLLGRPMLWILVFSLIYGVFAVRAYFR